jgi:hypothetical protein
MKRKMLFGFIVVCSLVFNAVFISMWMVHAVPRHFMKYCPCRSEKNLQVQCPLQKALSLSDSQWNQLHPGIESVRETTSGLYREMEKNRAALVNELEKTPIDSAALSACKERIIVCQKNIQALVINHILEEKKMLTQEQQKRFFNAIRSNMSCAVGPGMAGMTPEGIGGHGGEMHYHETDGRMQGHEKDDDDR